jgi:hypothetical protein
MVKRAIAIVAGAAAGVALWYFVVWAREEMQPEPAMSFGDCTHYGYDCVGYEPEEPKGLPAPVAPSVADPCKSWLSGAAGSGTADLSRCLHTARRGDDLERLEQAKWARRTAAPS